MAGTKEIGITVSMIRVGAKLLNKDTLRGRILPILLVFCEQTELLFAHCYEVIQVHFDVFHLLLSRLEIVYLVDFLRI